MVEPDHGSTVRNNLMTREGYTPYCGGCDIMPRTKWDGEQFKCCCGWRSKFPDDFLKMYRHKWHQPENA